MAATITVDPVFKTAGKKPGLEIWHIEKMQVKPLEAKLYGKFNTGDAYIVLNTQKDLKFNIHFWLGKNATLDEGGVAAYKSVELDHSLGGVAVQYREVQEHETKQFLSYFITGITYVEQETASGMKHVEKEGFTPRLFHVKGRRNIRVIPIKLSWSSINSGDVFIIDFGLTIYVWNGSGATHVEKMKALDAAMRLRDEERGGAKIEIIEEKAMPADFVKQMNATAEGTPRDIQKEVDDLTFEKKAKELVKLYKVSDASGELKIDEVGSYPLKREQLNSKDCFIVDTGSTAIYVWLGKGSSHQERKAAFKTALDFIQTKGYPSWTTVASVLEGAESFLFKQNFSNWISKEETPVPQLVKSRTSIGSSLPAKFDVSKILQRGTRESQKLVDGGTGKVEVWVTEKSEMVPLDPRMYGHFFAEDTYVILYTYTTDTERYIIYFWLGQSSTPAEKAAAALHTIDLNKKLKGAAVEIRVVQNKEPDHFMLVFKGKMIVHTKGTAAGHKGRLGNKTYQADGVSLFQVHGTNDFNLRAIQVSEKAASLNSNDCYVLECPAQTFIWYGKVCSGDGRLMANYVSSAVSPGRETINIHEGEEPPNFWKALGGKTEYPTAPAVVTNVPSHPARLFQCSNASGKFIVEEIFDFSQEDLIPDDVMILDTYDYVFVWIGKDSHQSDQKEGLEVAMKYLERDPSGRQVDSTLLLQVKQGFEPTPFTCHFFGWNPDLWASIPNYADYVKLVSSGVTSGQSELNKYDKNLKYKYEELKGGKVPAGVDPTSKEYHLSEVDFKNVFGISIHEYRALPKWKQNNMKKKMDLY